MADFVRRTAASWGLSTEAAADLAARFRQRVLPRQHVWLARGTPARAAALVERGLLCLFYDRDGDELASYLGLPGAWVVPIRSFVQQTPSPEQAVALAETVLWEISHDALFDFVHHHPEGWPWYAHLLEYQVGCMEDSRRDALMLPLHARYERLLAQEPELLQAAPLRYVAAVLGARPEHLSRIRRQMAQEARAQARAAQS